MNKMGSSRASDTDRTYTKFRVGGIGTIVALIILAISFGIYWFVTKAKEATCAVIGEGNVLVNMTVDSLLSNIKDRLKIIFDQKKLPSTLNVANAKGTLTSWNTINFVKYIDMITMKPTSGSMTVSSNGTVLSINLCVPKIETNIDVEAMVYAALHEMTHVAHVLLHATGDSHSPEYWSSFQILLKHAEKIGCYKVFEIPKEIYSCGTNPSNRTLSGYIETDIGGIPLPPWS